MEILIAFTIIAFTLVSSNLTEERNNISQNMTGYRGTLDAINQYFSTRLTIDHSEQFANHLWVDMEMNKCANSGKKLSSMIIQLPFDFEVFGHNIRKVKVMRKGGIRSADPNLRWSAIPLRIKKFDEFTPCPIKYGVHANALVIQWDFLNHFFGNRVELSFQLKISPRGIFFVYKKIPYGSLQDAPLPQLLNIANNFGVSNEFKVPGTHDTFDLGFQLKINETVIMHNTVISIKSLPLCPSFHTRSSCLDDAKKSGLTCFWCPTIRICSSKRDFLEKIWKKNDCKPITNSGRDEEGHLQNFIMVCTIAITLGLLIVGCYGCYMAFNSLLKKCFPSSQFRTNVNSNSAVQHDEHDLNHNHAFRQNFELHNSMQGSLLGLPAYFPPSAPPLPAYFPPSTPPPPYTEHVNAEFVRETSL